jgi:translation initiation factor IF-3
LLDAEGEMLGVVELDEAKRRAYDSGLDLVEISPDSRPPVCKIMDFGKFKYEQSKKEKANKAKSKASEMKEVRLGRSMKIDPHDVGIRVAQARRFLIEGHRVQIIQNFRGREMAFRSKGDDRMYDIIQRLSDLAKVEVPPRLNGRRMGMILVPEKQKIEAYKKKMVAEGKPILPTIPEQLAGFAHEDDDDDDDDLDGMDDGHDGGHEDMHGEMHAEPHDHAPEAEVVTPPIVAAKAAKSPAAKSPAAKSPAAKPPAAKPPAAKPPAAKPKAAAPRAATPRAAKSSE